MLTLNKSIASLKILLSTKDTRTIFVNFFSLGIIQGTNFLLPLIVLPYLVSVIGLAKYGSVAFAQSLVFYLSMVTEYGFNLSTTRSIAFHKGQNQKISEIVSTTLLAKLMLCAFAFVSLVGMINLVPMFDENRNLYYFGFLMVIGQALIPTWFFQGVEQMKYITYINLASKVIQTLLIFWLIRVPSDYVYVLLAYGIGSLISGIGGLWLMAKKFDISIKLPSYKKAWQELRSGWYIFLSHFSINICSNSNIFILGFFANEITVGYYSIAEKVLSVARQFLMIFFQATYPSVCKQVLKGHQYVVGFFRNYAIPFSVAIAFLSLVMFIFADFITRFFVGHPVPEIISAIKWMMIIPVIMCFQGPAFQTLLAYNYQKSYTYVYVSASIVNILLNLVLARYFLIPGTIAAMFITEVFITVGLHAVLFIEHPENIIINWKANRIKGIVKRA